MSIRRTLVTPRDPQGRHIITICEAGLKKARLDGKGMVRLQNRGGELKRRATELFQELAAEPPGTYYDRAYEIMGGNFFGVHEAFEHFGIKKFTAEQRALFEFAPYPEEKLFACKDTHLLITTFPLSIVDIRGKTAKHPGQPVFFGQPEYNNEGFATMKCEARWHLIRKTAEPASTSKSWNEQQVLLAADEVSPTARVLVYAIVAHYLATGVRLFSDVYVQTADFDSRGRRVSVGGFRENGLLVAGNSDERPKSHVGITSEVLSLEA